MRLCLVGMLGTVELDLEAKRESLAEACQEASMRPGMSPPPTIQSSVGE